MEFCSKCGAQMPADAGFCGECGAAADAPTGIALESTVASMTAKDDDAAKTFVGKNYDYFGRKWQAAEKKPGKQSWNWAAFVFGLGWLAYRKMYLYSFIFIGLVGLETIFEIVFGVSGKVSTAVTVAIAVTFGMQGNNLYKLHVEKKIKEAEAMNTPEQKKYELTRQGGTNIGAAIGFIFGLLATLALIGFATGQLD